MLLQTSFGGTRIVDLLVGDPAAPDLLSGHLLMHELAITESIVATVVERMPDTPVRRRAAGDRRLSGVVPDAVRFCFDLVTAGTTLEGAELEIDEPGGRAGVPDVRHRVRLGRRARAVPRAAARTSSCCRGRELRIRSVEVAA